MPFWTICSDSLALRVSATSSSSKPNSLRPALRRTVCRCRSISPRYCTGSMFDMSMYRLIASSTTRGLGHVLPLLRLISVRSSVNAS